MPAEHLVADFTVRIYEDDPHHCRVEVVGNRSGTTASARGLRGLGWVFALLRALKDAGAYPTATHEADHA